MDTHLNIGLIDTPLSGTKESTAIKRWGIDPDHETRKYLSHSDINIGLLLGHESIAETPILPDCRVYLAESVQETNLSLKLLEALDWMANQPIKVLAMPFGEHHGSPFMIPMIQQLLDKDILPVAAIGNKGAGQFSAPGCYQGVLSVGATDRDGHVAAYSGSLNQQNGQCVKPDVVTNGEVFAENRTFQGTSFATTRVAGTLALLRNQNPSVTCQQFINHTCTSSTPLPEAFQRRCAHGTFNPETLKKQLTSNTLEAQSPLSISGKFTDPQLLRVLKQTAANEELEVIACPENHDLEAYKDVKVLRTFAENRVFHIQAPVATLKMMHAQPDILVLQSLHIPPISILQLR